MIWWAHLVENDNFEVLARDDKVVVGSENCLREVVMSVQGCD